MSEEEDIEARGRLAKVAQQVAAVCDGDAFSIECPYCGRISIQDGNFCCYTLKRAIKAVLDARQKFSKAVTRHMVN